MKKVLGVIVAIFILMIASVVFQLTKILLKSSEFGQNMYDSYGKIGVLPEVVIGMLPLIIGIWLVKLSWRKITYEEPKEILKKSTTEPSLTKAVYNHGKDLASDIKPAIDAYRDRHQSTTHNAKIESSIDTQNKIEKYDSNGFLICPKCKSSNNTKNEECWKCKYVFTQQLEIMNEDEIYEKVMLEIEEDRKIRATWAKALAQSDGDQGKAEALYIQMRVKVIQVDNEVQQKKEPESNIAKKRSLEIFVKTYNLTNLERINESKYSARYQGGTTYIKWFDGPNYWRFF